MFTALFSNEMLCQICVGLFLNLGLFLMLRMIRLDQDAKEQKKSQDKTIGDDVVRMATGKSSDLESTAECRVDLCISG